MKKSVLLVMSISMISLLGSTAFSMKKTKSRLGKREAAWAQDQYSLQRRGRVPALAQPHVDSKLFQAVRLSAEQKDLATKVTELNAHLTALLAKPEAEWSEQDIASIKAHLDDMLADHDRDFERTTSFAHEQPARLGDAVKKAHAAMGQRGMVITSEMLKPIIEELLKAGLEYAKEEIKALESGTPAEQAKARWLKLNLRRVIISLVVIASSVGFGEWMGFWDIIPQEWACAITQWITDGNLGQLWGWMRSSNATA